MKRLEQERPKEYSSVRKANPIHILRLPNFLSNPFIPTAVFLTAPFSENAAEEEDVEGHPLPSPLRLSLFPALVEGIQAEGT